MMRLVYLTALAALATGHVVEYPLQSLIEDFWNWRLQNVPEFASSINVRDYDDMVESYSLDAFDTRKDDVTEFLGRLRLIQRSSLSTDNAVTYDVLEDTLQTYLDGYKWRYYGPSNPINRMQVGGMMTDVGYFVQYSKFDTETDFRNFLSRVNALTQRIYDCMARMNKSIEMGTTNYETSMTPVLGQIDKLLVYTADNISGFAFYAPFSTLDAMSLSSDIKNELRAQAMAASLSFLEGMRVLKDYLINVYMPRTRAEPGVGSLPDGEAYYRACLKWHLSIDISAEEVYQIGLDEVARITSEMEKAMKNLNFDGTMQEFFQQMRSRDEFLIEDSDEVLNRYRSLIKDRIGSTLPNFFRDIPDMPIVVRLMTGDGPLAFYRNGAPDGSRPGVFYVNAKDKFTNPTYSMVALALHEGDPGHHLQDMYALNSSTLPVFRKVTDFTKYFAAPLHFPFYTAYSEGWAMYSESLGEEMGVYQDDNERMGRYEAEMFRACRLVVDTGIHHYGWSREKAIQYMLNNTIKARSGLESEIDRYITWPGQATSYKMGGIKFKQIRQKAIDALAKHGHFDLKEFHFISIGNGAMPLTVLEKMVDDWVMTVRREQCLDLPKDQCVTAAATQATNHNACYILLLAVMFLLNW